MSKARQYFTLLIRNSKAEPWAIHSGDYALRVVERKTMDWLVEQLELESNTKIIITDDTQAAVDAAVAKLNSAAL